MLAAIEAARVSVRLETYIFTAGVLGEQLRAALIRSTQRGVRVGVLVDALGSLYLFDSFWASLRNAGASVRWFNPLSLDRFDFRNHRKLLVCDEQVAFVGGFNIAPEYQGDGVTRGWRDLGLMIRGPLARQLAASFEVMYAGADFCHKRFARLRKSMLHGQMPSPDSELLLSGPGWGCNPFKRALRCDLVRAHSAKIIAAYFLPTWRIRRALLCLARRGGKVQLLLAGKSDVPVSQLACRRLYAGLLRAGIEIFEYQPQVLHAKLILLDDRVYVGSANLDVRSLGINYELVLRLQNAPLAAEADAIFNEALTHSRRIDPAAWRNSRTFWAKLKERWAYFLLARVDPYIARRQMRHLR
jgi:cardiolipin synthase